MINTQQNNKNYSDIISNSNMKEFFTIQDFRKISDADGREIADTLRQYDNLFDIICNTKIERQEETLFAMYFLKIVYKLLNSQDNEKLIGMLFQKNFMSYHQNLDKEQFLIYEPNTYYEQYQNTLAALQVKNLHNFPFQEQILKLSQDIKKPAYLNEQNNQFNFKLNDNYDENLNENPNQNGQVQNVEENQWELNFDQVLNKDQFEAFKNTFQRELSLIQGPPGTGKTYLGSKIVEQLLLNKNKWNSNTPIIVFSQTNHGLDQFLQRVLKFTNNVIRVGGFSKDINMKEYNLKEKRKFYPKSLGNLQTYKRQCQQELDDLKDKFLCNLFPTIKELDQHFYLENQQKFSIIFQKEFQIKFHQFYNQNKEKFNNIEFENIFDNKEIIENIYNKVWTLDFSKTDNILDIFHSEIMSHIQNKLELKDQEEYIKKLIQEFCYQMIKLSQTNGSPIENQNTQYQENIQNFLENNQSSPQSNNFSNYLTAEKYIKKILKRQEIIKKIEGYQIWDIQNNEKMDLLQQIKKKQKRNDQLKFDELFTDYQDYYEQEKQLDIKRDLQIIKNAEVVGLTASGGVKFDELIKQLKPQIVVIEEASLLLQSQNLSIINDALQHLIMIGDHQQLKPIIQSQELIKKNWNISLFERLIKSGIPKSFLGIQNRMRPEIADYIRLFYGQQYRDSESVKNYEDIKGFSSNVQFFSYKYGKNKKEEQEGSTKSFKNIYEAEILANLFLHILEIKEFTMDQITILTMYDGQIKELEKQIFEILQKKSFESDQNRQYYFDYKKKVRIASVDSFQGQESEIILLSTNIDACKFVIPKVVSNSNVQRQQISLVIYAMAIIYFAMKSYNSV
ncbi:P-loop containing nucleoside triphosphate hydrolase [Pseudocohnilembus persalinus]|uniref:p-loop containing nucleoside triphosphate hydrolase n=1 Tax=Pseudocohnilembus persalinus TaxID=266149 RepID=A0A0V0QQT3_PSEPJ|nr:P-loop containing nucleoside triphosphate hydrolase [Pseudocohnilembus persalinus]|eukprot:KRX04639.1 P-loop containing nucleoside triphosphate hydrolase [Pseudocohnilembus persalinus]